MRLVYPPESTLKHDAEHPGRREFGREKLFTAHEARYRMMLGRVCLHDAQRIAEARISASLHPKNSVELARKFIDWVIRQSVEDPETWKIISTYSEHDDTALARLRTFFLNEIEQYGDVRAAVVKGWRPEDGSPDRGA